MSAAIPDRLLLVGDARTRLAELPAGSIDTCVTSPPYFWLRDYLVRGQIGMEPQVDMWVDELRLVFRGLARVLKPQGSAWLVVADSYSRHPRYGAPAKSLLLAPERLALALSADGWIVRNRIAWTKPNPIPNSVRDRLNATWEFVYLLTRSPRYHFDLDAIRIPHRSRRTTPRRPIDSVTIPPTRPAWAGPLAGSQSGLSRLKYLGLPGHTLGKNPGDHWNIATASFRGQHFATFPERLVERCVQATTPARVCGHCGLAWIHRRSSSDSGSTWTPACSCHAGWQPGIVVDPFFGAGTVGVVAERLKRRWCGIELSPAFAAMAEDRIAIARNKHTEEAESEAA